MPHSPRGQASPIARSMVDDPVDAGKAHRPLSAPRAALVAPNGCLNDDCSAARVSSPRPRAAPSVAPRGDRRLEGWAIIEKINRCVHAVGRVSGGRGSAILVALPEHTEKERARASARAQSVAVRRQRRRRRQRARLAASAGLYASGTVPLGGGGTDDNDDNDNDDDEEADDEAGDGRAPLAVLLTTSAVLSSVEDARGLTVTFLEQPVAGTAALLGREPVPFTVHVRADAGLVCSVASTRPTWAPPDATAAPEQAGGDTEASEMRPPDSAARGASTAEMDAAPEEATAEEAEEIGYVLTYCESAPRTARASGSPRSGNSGVGGSCRSDSRAGSRTRVPRTNASLASASVAESGAGSGLKHQTQDSVWLVNPLPLPLLLSAIPPVKVGDTHLMVTHVDGGERCYVVQHVAAVHRDFCEYAEDAALRGDYSSGGPVFNANGDFIGLQHRLGSQSICMFTASIVHHLFAADKLGMCRTPISGQPSPDDGTFGERVVTTMEHVPEEVFNQPFRFTQPSSVTDVGVEGGRLIDFDDLERIRRERERSAPLTERQPAFSEVYREFYRDFGSLMHMLNAFYYCPALTARVLDTMVSAQYRGELQTVASSGGVGIVLVVMDAYPECESLVATALSALSRMCLHRHNLVAFNRLDGIATVLEVMKEYPHSVQILQWGSYCLAHATQPDAPEVGETVDLLLRCSAVEVATAALRAHGTRHAHLTRWMSTAVANAVRVRPRAVTLCVQEDLPQLVLDLIASCTQAGCDADLVVVGLLTLLSDMLAPLRDELPDFSPLCSIWDAAAAPHGRSGGRDGDELISTDEAAAVTAALQAQLEQFEDLRPHVGVSPLAVSAYFAYTTLAAQPCEGFYTSPEQEEEPLAATGGSELDSTPPPPPIPRTPLNELLLALLARTARERRSHASEELLGVCLDILLVLDTWGLLPVHYVVDRRTWAAADGSTDRDEDRGARSGSTAPGGFSTLSVQQILDGVRTHYAASAPLMARLRQLSTELG